jgi:hypothetical protein
MRWHDIESAIESFSEMGHPKAIELRNALNLARAAEEAGPIKLKNDAYQRGRLMSGLFVF